MFSRKMAMTGVAGVLFFLGISHAQAKFLKIFGRHEGAPDVVLPDCGPGDSGIVPKYGYDPHFVYNEYPWKAPAMYSGFRHYHYPPPHPVVGPEEHSAPDQGGFPGFDEDADPRTAVISVKVPESAEVWIFGSKTKQEGSFRRFVTPPLENGQKSWYEVKATWMDGKKKVEQTRRVNLFPGARPLVDFLASEEETAPLLRPRKLN
jgi:uncharacterized protein (TIGR03000 family)